MTSSEPPQLSYQSKTYLTLSTTTPSLVLASSSNASDSDPDSPSSQTHSQSSSTSSASSTHATLLSSLAYVGPVGSLPNSHIFSLPVPSENPPREDVNEVKRLLEGTEGVKEVEVMVPRRRAKRVLEV